MTEVLIRGGHNTEKHRERPRGDGGRDWSSVSASHETPGFPATPAARVGDTEKIQQSLWRKHGLPVS